MEITLDDVIPETESETDSVQGGTAGSEDLEVVPVPEADSPQSEVTEEELLPEEEGEENQEEKGEEAEETVLVYQTGEEALMCLHDDVHFLINDFLPFSIAVLVVYLGCWWFYRTFCR